jgi:hypothetical protein
MQTPSLARVALMLGALALGFSMMEWGEPASDAVVAQNSAEMPRPAFTCDFSLATPQLATEHEIVLEGDYSTGKRFKLTHGHRAGVRIDEIVSALADGINKMIDTTVSANNGQLHFPEGFKLSYVHISSVGPDGVLSASSELTCSDCF